MFLSLYESKVNLINGCNGWTGREIQVHTGLITTDNYSDAFKHPIKPVTPTETPHAISILSYTTPTPVLRSLVSLRWHDLRRYVPMNGGNLKLCKPDSQTSFLAQIRQELQFMPRKSRRHEANYLGSHCFYLFNWKSIIITIIVIATMLKNLVIIQHPRIVLGCC